MSSHCVDLIGGASPTIVIVWVTRNDAAEHSQNGIWHFVWEFCAPTRCHRTANDTAVPLQALADGPGHGKTI